MLLSPNELLGIKMLQMAPANAVAQEPVCGSPLVAIKDWRRSEEGRAAALMISNINQAGVWGGGLQRSGSGRLVLSKASLPERQEGCAGGDSLG